MLCKFPMYLIILNLLQNNFIYSKESPMQNKNKNYIKKIFKSINSFQGRLLSFMENNTNENSTDSKASSWLTNKVGELLRREVGPFIKNRTKNVSESCKETLFHYLIYDINNNTNNIISDYHLKKFFEGASKHKSDLSTYDICMYNNFRIRTESNKDEFAESIYLIITIDKSNLKIENSTELYYTKANADVENIFYIRGFCFPQKIINGTESCSDSDYYHFLKEVNDDLDDILGLGKKEEDINITYFVLKRENFSPGVYFARIIPFLLILIQIILIFCSQCIKCKCLSTKKIQKIDKLITDTNDAVDSDDKKGSFDIAINSKTKKGKKVIEYPKWVKIYKKCFNLSENFKELFNFSLNSTEINNDSGLTYIRGLKSFSFIFLIFGLTFLTFINSFSKTYSKFLMNEFLKYPFFPLFFIGLRYSPRIIFSCSGYTLSFKYVSYIQKNQSIFGIIKFFLYQIHKYLLLLLFFLFERYSLFLILNPNMETTRPMWAYFEKNILSNPVGGMFLISFLDLTTIYTRVGNKRIDQTLIDYFWLPFNEMLFFVVGFFLITIGYKFKFRIDFVILIMILINLIVKIIFSYVKKTMEGESYYATLYYYIFDYGKFMIHPIFNLPYYLIGMYFGLINYSVQKGITSLYINTTSQDKEMIDLQKMFTVENTTPDNKEEEEENKEEENKEEENKEEENKEEREEIKQLPFLKSGVSITYWLKDLKNKYLKIIGIIIVLLLLFFSICHYIFYEGIIVKEYNSLYNILKDIDDNSEDIDNVAIDNEYKKMDDLLLLDKYIKNGFVNFLYRIDIEIYVLLIQSILFILYFKGRNFINDFFCHIFWGVLNKPYYSMILTANPLILYIFYQSETRIILNFFNVMLYSIISGCVIFLFGIITYLFFELPFKRLIHTIFNWEDQEDNSVDDEGQINKNKDKDD